MIELKVKTTSKKLKNIVSAVSKMDDEARFIPKEESIRVETITSDIVGVVIGEIPADSLDKYNKGEREIVRMNIGKLNSFLGRSKQDVIFKTNENKLTIKIGENRTFKIPILDSIDGENELEGGVTNEIDYSDKAEIKMEAKQFRKAVKDCSIFSKTAKIKVEDERLKVIGKGKSEKAEFEISDNPEVTIEGEGNSLFSIDYLKKVLKGIKLSDRVIIRIGDNYPFQAEFEDKMKLKYVIAPRIEEE